MSRASSIADLKQRIEEGRYYVSEQAIDVVTDGVLRDLGLAGLPCPDEEWSDAYARECFENSQAEGGAE